MQTFTNQIDEELKAIIDRDGVFFIKETMKDYLSRVQFVSASKLHTILSQTPKDFIYQFNEEIKVRSGEQMEEETDALRMGSAFHKMLLEPDDFHKEFAILKRSNLPVPDKDYRTKANKEYKDNFIATCAIAGMSMLSEEEADDLEAMHDELMANPTAKNIFSQEGVVELSIYTKIEWNGIEYYVKIRPDFFSIKKPFYLDVKKTRSASPKMNKFPSDAFSYGYDLKIALYFDILAQHWAQLMTFCKVEKLEPLKRALIIAVEDTAPYKNVVYNVPEETMLIGRYRYHAALDRLRKCLETNQWPAYEIYSEEGNKGIVDLVLPSYAGAEIVV